MKKKALKVIVLCFTLSIFLSTNGVANASEPEYAQSQYEDDLLQLKDFFNQYGVNESIQNELINKINNGQPLDSMKENTEAVSSYVKNTNRVIENVSVYQDGSISVTSVEPVVEEIIGNDFITPFGIGGGSSNSGSGYVNNKNKKVYYNTGIINAYFFANYTFVNGGNDYISSAYDPKVVVTFGTHSGMSLKLVRKNETLDNKATAKLSFDYKMFANQAGGNAWLKLTVGKDKATETHSY